MLNNPDKRLSQIIPIPIFGWGDRGEITNPHVEYV